MVSESPDAFISAPGTLARPFTISNADRDRAASRFASSELACVPKEFNFVFNSKELHPSVKFEDFKLKSDSVSTGAKGLGFCNISEKIKLGNARSRGVPSSRNSRLWNSKEFGKLILVLRSSEFQIRVTRSLSGSNRRQRAEGFPSLRKLNARLECQSVAWRFWSFYSTISGQRVGWWSFVSRELNDSSLGSGNAHVEGLSQENADILAAGRNRALLPFK